MRELVIEEQRVLVIPQNFKNSNTGTVKAVRVGEFELELDYEPKGIFENTICEFYTQAKNGKLHFDTYAKKIEGKKLIIASPAKHKFLQRRQYTRVKYLADLKLINGKTSYNISTLDISAGGLKFKTKRSLNIKALYDVELPLSENNTVKCKFDPIRIEKGKDGIFIVSGQFIFENNTDKMFVVLYCAKRRVEIENK